ncbi:MAG: hypothetical protein JSR71_13460 [Proteobacteria bacterium]|jgi:hypothetical protein|nr:hypothetical protein [Pseudomonadota bacterium]MBS1949488.1 hypothetical protein [Bacteroidota bacterium]MBS1982506.1 hypothetical protein [Bacteroidota bacterium]WHZ09045.1 MAG: hypothetical protein OJF59_002799 [Cytophagales bacterium]
MENQEEGKKKLSLKEFFSLGEVGGYFFRGKDPSRPTNINIKMMHGVNKISIVIFLAGIIYLLLKRYLWT